MTIYRYLAILITITLLSACQSHFSSTTRKVVLSDDNDVINLEERLNDGRHVQKVDNLLFLVDDSIPQLKKHDGFLQRDLLFALLTRMQRTIPQIKLEQGLRIFGPYANEYDFKNTLLYGMAQGRKSRIKPFIINNTPADSMFNPVAMALDAEYQELREVPGNTAIIILSSFSYDSSRTIMDKQSLFTSALEIKQFYNDRVSIYPVYFSPGKTPSADINDLSKVAINGFWENAKNLQEPDDLADFMENVLFEINTPPPVISPMPAAKVENPPLSHEKLIKEKELRVQLKTQFDFNKATIRPEYKQKLQSVADFMIKFPDTTTVLEGHTCSMGTAEYNLKLSARRAMAVKNYLVKAGVDASRLAIKAYGESRPIADNNTVIGREENRRVVAVIKTIVQEK